MTPRSAARALAGTTRRRVVLGALAVCGAISAAAPVGVRDDTGQMLTLAQPARRAVTLAPHLAELVVDAGAGDRLVGVMRYSDQPAAAARLPVIGDAFAINLEAVARLAPDLLLVWRSGINPRQQQRLTTLGLPIFTSEITRVEDIADTLRRLGRLFGTEAAADAAAQRVEADWHALRRRYAGRAPVRVFYQMWHAPLMTVGRGHLIAQAISACGGVNVFGDLDSITPTVSREAAVRADPQLIVTGTDGSEPARLEDWLRFGQVSAVRRGHVVALDGHRLARMTPQFIAGTEALCDAIERARH